MICTAGLLLAASASGLWPQTTGGTVRLNDYATCGTNCLYTVARLKGIAANIADIERACGLPDADGTHSFADLARAAGTVGLRTFAVRETPRDLAALGCPFVAQVLDSRREDQKPHFVVVLRVVNDRVYLLDPPMPAYSIPVSMFERAWTGHAILFPNDDGELSRLEAKYSETAYLYWLQWGTGALAAVLIAVPLVRLARRGIAVGRFRVAFCAGAAIAVGAAGFFAYRAYIAPPRDPVPSVHVDRVYNLGVLPLGVRKTSIRLRNTSPAAVTVAAIKSSCSCTTPTPPETIPAGAHADVDLVLSVSGGPQSAVLEIRLDGEAAPVTTTVRWKSTADVVCQPSAVDARGLSPDRPAVANLMLTLPYGSEEKPVIAFATGGADTVRVVYGAAQRCAVAYGASATDSRRLYEIPLQIGAAAPKSATVVAGSVLVTVKHDGQLSTVSVPYRFTFAGPEQVAVPEANARGADALRTPGAVP